MYGRVIAYENLVMHKCTVKHAHTQMSIHDRKKNVMVNIEGARRNVTYKISSGILLLPFNSLIIK